MMIHYRPYRTATSTLLRVQNTMNCIFNTDLSDVHVCLFAI